MKVVIKKTNCPDLIIVNGKAVNFINGKIDLLEFIKKRDILNDAEKKAAMNRSNHLKSLIKGNHLHHWSYKEEHWKDVIELPPKGHAKIHRYMIYDQERMMYRVAVSGLLLDTKASHMEFANNIINNMPKI